MGYIPAVGCQCALILLFSVLAKRNKTAPYRVFACTFLPVTIGFIAFLTERIADLGKACRCSSFTATIRRKRSCFKIHFRVDGVLPLVACVPNRLFVPASVPKRRHNRRERSAFRRVVYRPLRGAVLCAFRLFRDMATGGCPTGVLVRQIAFMVLACLAGVAAILRMCKLLQRDFGWSAQVVPVFGTVSLCSF